MTGIAEDAVERLVLQWLRDLGYSHLPGPSVTPEGDRPERSGWDIIVLGERLRVALARLNPDVPADAIEDAARIVIDLADPALIDRNEEFHTYVRDGVTVSFMENGREVHDVVRLLDADTPEHNDLLAVNQLVLRENGQTRRADVVVYVNGLPLALFELKKPGAENASVREAFNQLETYKVQTPCLFTHNEVLVVSDGIDARHGTLSSDFARMMPWKSIESSEVVKGLPALEVLVKGMFEPRRFLDLVQNFVVFEQEPKLVKKMAAYHQYHAVNTAVEETVRAVGPGGDRRVGVVWHTQGSGKSLSMVFYAAKVQRHPALENPTLVILTDRNDLDDQLLGTFAQARELVGEPQQARDRKHLRELLRVASGGVVFTTIQKFADPDHMTHPVLTDRRNVIVIADEAHRSQYDFVDGFAANIRQALPNASFVGFTGTPIEKQDKDTRAVFGDYIDVYDIARAVEDHATVPIYYESRLVKLGFTKEAEEALAAVDELARDDHGESDERAKTKWARLEAVVGSEKRIAAVAKDIVEHYERRAATLEGKAMVVCMSRRICVALHDAIRQLRPAWFDADDAKGSVKVVITGSASDGPALNAHVRPKSALRALQNRVRGPNDPLKIVIVRDMWLTGFDAPVLHTMYVDKPMQGHSLMQAIARVNRVFKDKPGGLVVDYLGIADALKEALALYSESSRKEAGIPIEDALKILRTQHDVLGKMFHGIAYQKYAAGSPEDALRLLAVGVDRVVGDPELKERFIQQSARLRAAVGLAGSHEKAAPLLPDVRYFLDVRASVLKGTVTQHASDDKDSAIREILNAAIAPEGVIDILAASGIAKPDIGILSDEFLDQISKMPQRNLAMELLMKLLHDEVRARARRNLVQGRSFREMLDATMARYANRAIDSAQVIAELVELAKDMREARKRGEELGLTPDEEAFYDALAENASARNELGDENLKIIAREVVKTIKSNVSIDWTMKEAVRARLRLEVRKVLRKYGYPPDKQEAATTLVLEQATLTLANWPHS